MNDNIITQEPKYEAAPDDTGTGWHVVITWPAGRVMKRGGFASESEAQDWIVANSGTSI
jgi:hypothetical protein